MESRKTITVDESVFNKLSELREPEETWNELFRGMIDELNSDNQVNDTKEPPQPKKKFVYHPIN